MRPTAELMYDPKLLGRLDFTKAPAKFTPQISAVNPGPGLLVRPLCTLDYDKGFIQLLSQLTNVGNISREQYLERFFTMKQRGNYFVTVIEDTTNGRIIGAATLMIQHKFIRDCGMRGHLEDVVVNGTYRGKQLGKLIVTTVTMLARELGCYKMTLECKDKLIPFYTSLGYTMEAGNANSMNIRFPDVLLRHKI